MTDEELRKSKYDYQQNSNLVLSSDRRNRRPNEPSGEVVSLKNRMVRNMIL